MSMERNMNLRDAIPQTPDMCKNAVLHAVSTYREEKNMQRTYKVILAVVLVLALLCGTAFAIANYYSVREYVALGNTSESFEKAIVPVEKGITSNGITFVLGDAVFDGKSLGFTMNVSAAEDTKSLYVLTMLEAYSGDTKLALNEYSAEGFDYCWGLIYPYMETEYSDQLPNRFGVSAQVEGVAAEVDISWRFIVHLLNPLGELVNQVGWDPDKDTYVQWQTDVQTLKGSGKIAVYGGRNIGDYLDALGVGGGEGPIVDMILKTGMFEKLDTLVFEFSTPVPELVNLAPEATFRMDGYTINVKSITTSMMQIEYELEAIYDQQQKSEHDLEQFWRLYDQNGDMLMSRRSEISLAEDMRTCKVKGNSMRISDEALTEIVFVPSYVRVKNLRELEREVPSFTVKLAQ